jgi:hypothetical protein
MRKKTSQIIITLFLIHSTESFSWFSSQQSTASWTRRESSHTTTIQQYIRPTVSFALTLRTSQTELGNLCHVLCLWPIQFVWSCCWCNEISYVLPICGNWCRKLIIGTCFIITRPLQVHNRSRKLFRAKIRSSVSVGESTALVLLRNGA